MGCTSSKVVQKDTLEKDVDDDMSPNIILHYKKEDSTSLTIFDDYTFLYLHNRNSIDGVLTKEEIRGLNKLYKTYGFIVADGGTESMLLHGSGPSSYTDPNLSSEMKSLIFVLTNRLNDELK